MTLPVLIVRSDEPADVEFADSVVARFRAANAACGVLQSAELLRIHRAQLAHPIIRALPGPAGVIPGPMLVVLSESILQDSELRRALIAAVSGMMFLYARHYYICRGLTPSAARERYPDLAQIYDNVMVRAESELEEAVEDCIRHSADAEKSFAAIMAPGLILIGGILVSLAIAASLRLYKVRLYLVLLTGTLLYFHRWPATTALLLAGTVYTLGFSLSMVQPLDLWPWLGRAWKWPDDLEVAQPARWSPILSGPIIDTGVAATIAAIVLGLGAYALAVLAASFAVQTTFDVVLFVSANRANRRAHAGAPVAVSATAATVDVAGVQAAIEGCLAARRTTIKDIVIPTAGFGALIAILAAKLDHGAGVALVLALALGAAAPTLMAWSFDAATRQVGKGAGLTARYLDRTTVALDLSAVSDVHRVETGVSMRRWLPTPDFAFVSYAWSDEQHKGLAAALENSLRTASVPLFRDVNSIVDPYAAWRADLAQALHRCTHFFLIVSPGIASGAVVQREIETIARRWVLEKLPAVICVGDPDAVDAFVQDPKTPPLVRAIGETFPMVTSEEARDPRVVRHIVEHTRRGGKWSDWLTTLSPMAARLRIARMRGLISSPPQSVPDSRRRLISSRGR